MKKVVAIYGTIHFIVDCACIYLMTAFLIPTIKNYETWLWCVLLYNFFAFAFQLPIGALADRLGHPALFSAFGCAVIGVSWLFLANPIFTVVIAGVGNGFFHIGGGVDVLTRSEGKAGPVGVYVSTGAFGVYLGARLAVKGLRSSGIAILLLVFSVGMLVFWDRYGGKKRITDRVKVHRVKTVHQAILFIGTCMLFTVCLRSYTGSILGFSWKAGPIWGLLFVLGVVLGKAAGGILSDYIGWQRLSIISLCISGLLFLFSFQNPLAGIFAVLLFNMTMPITLAALVELFPDDKGTAFGLTTFALFLGTIPTTLGIDFQLFQPIGLLGLTFFSAVILTIGFGVFTKKEMER